MILESNMRSDSSTILMEIFLVEMILIKNENDPREMFVYFLVVIVITRVKLS